MRREKPGSCMTKTLIVRRFPLDPDANFFRTPDRHSLGDITGWG